MCWKLLRTRGLLLSKANAPLPHDNARTTDPQNEDRKDGLRKIKRSPFALVLGLFGIYIFSVNIFTAIKVGTVEYAGRLTHNMTVSYQDHPKLFLSTLLLSVVGIPFCAGLLYVIFFKKIDAD